MLEAAWAISSFFPLPLYQGDLVPHHSPSSVPYGLGTSVVRGGGEAPTHQVPSFLTKSLRLVPIVWLSASCFVVFCLGLRVSVYEHILTFPSLKGLPLTSRYVPPFLPS